MASINTRLNIERLDVNIVQKHGGSKQVGFKQFGSDVETGVHGVHDEKRVWFEMELQGAQGDREAEVFQVSNDDTAVAQRRLEDKQPEEKTNIDCLRSIQQCMKNRVAKHLGVTGIQQQNGLVNETNVTLFAKVLHGFEFEVEPLGDHTFEVEPRKNIDQRAGLQEVQTQDLMDYQLARDREQHLACELFGSKEDSNEAAFLVAIVEKIYAHESLTFNNIVACEVISKWKAGLKDDMDAQSDVYVLSNGCRKCSDESDCYYWGYTPANGNVLAMEIVTDQWLYSEGVIVQVVQRKVGTDFVGGTLHTVVGG
nr:zinc finger, CCHC-type [Tanacetum cinerariifolium]